MGDLIEKEGEDGVVCLGSQLMCVEAGVSSRFRPLLAMCPVQQVMQMGIPWS